MISEELYKRILSASILLPLLIVCIFLNQYIFLLFLILIGIISLSEWYSMHKGKSFLIFILGFIFLLLSIVSAFKLRGYNYESMIFFTWILFICFFSDIGGYVFGKIIGGKKLLKISPNKTIAGTIGSLIFSFLPILIINYQVFYKINLELNLITFILSLIVSIFCQLGDILISYFKRLRKIKDTGNLLPGHGGMLDRIDGIIFVLPFVYLLKFVELI